MWLKAGPDQPESRYSEYLELDLSTVVPSIAGPKRPQDRIALTDAKDAVPQGAADLRRARRGRLAATPSPSRPATRGIDDGGEQAGRRRRRNGRPSNEGVGHRRRGARVRDRPRHRLDRRDHDLHQHVEPVGHAGRRDARQERRREGPHGRPVGQDHRWPRAPRSSPTTTRRPACGPTSRSSASTSSATAARRASATRARSSRRSPRRSTTTTSPSRRSSRATATSRVASTPT